MKKVPNQILAFFISTDKILIVEVFCRGLLSLAGLLRPPTRLWLFPKWDLLVTGFAPQKKKKKEKNSENTLVLYLFFDFNLLEEGTCDTLWYRFGCL